MTPGEVGSSLVSHLGCVLFCLLTCLIARPFRFRSYTDKNNRSRDGVIYHSVNIDVIMRNRNTSERRANYFFDGEVPLQIGDKDRGSHPPALTRALLG